MKKWEDDGFKSPAARAKGLGSARTGVTSWMRLRLTAVANLLLTGWFVWFVYRSIGLSHGEFTAFLAQPYNAIAMILLIIPAFWHAALGNREIIEDYIHLEWFKTIKLAGLNLFFSAAALAGVFFVLKIAFTGP
jgi:succinate dehydrogenase / fumarate reductase membrane anchor subunit